MSRISGLATRFSGAFNVPQRKSQRRLGCGQVGRGVKRASGRPEGGERRAGRPHTHTRAAPFRRLCPGPGATSCPSLSWSKAGSWSPAHERQVRCAEVNRAGSLFKSGPAAVLLRPCKAVRRGGRVQHVCVRRCHCCGKNPLDRVPVKAGDQGENFGSRK